MVEPTAEFAQPQLGFVDQAQWRYEVIHPLVLLGDCAAAQRVQETETYPDTDRRLPPIPVAALATAKGRIYP